MTELETRSVGRAGVRLTRLGLGCAPLGNLFHAIGDDAAAATVDAAWHSGIRYFDTAPHYGLGLSERRLGAALRGLPRNEFAVSTKVGRLLVPAGSGGPARDNEGYDVPATHRRVWDFSRDGILRSVEDSLHRLGLDRVDILFLHDPDDHWAQAVDEGYPALAELRDQGVVKAIGAGMNQAEMLARFVRHTDLDLLMLAGRYTLLEQGPIDDLLPLCEQRGVGIVAAGAFNSGLLSRPRPAADATYNYAPAPAELIDRAHQIADVCERHGTSLPAAALRFPFAHRAVVAVAVGCHSASQVRRNLELLRQPVPPVVWSDLRDAGLLRPDAPVPGEGVA